VTWELKDLVSNVKVNEVYVAIEKYAGQDSL